VKEIGKRKSAIPPCIESKIYFCFPDAVVNHDEDTVTMNMLDVWRLLVRLDYLEHPSGHEAEPPKFMGYREGGWIGEHYEHQ